MNIKKRLLAVILLTISSISFLHSWDTRQILEIFENDDFASFKRIFNNKTAISERSEDKFTIVQWLSSGGNLEWLQYLVKMGANIHAPVDADAPERGGHTPLMIASWGGNLEVVEYFESLGGDINYVTSDTGQSVMDMACRGGKLEVVKYLLPRVKNKSKTGRLSHLTWAVSNNRPLVAKFLIESGVNLNVDTEGIYSYKNMLAGGSLPEIFKLLLTKDIDWNVSGGASGQPIMAAVASSPITTRELLKKNVRLDGYEFYNKLDVLQTAIRYQNPYTLQMLLDAGLSAETVNVLNGKTALQYAKDLNLALMVQILEGKKRVSAPAWTLEDEIAAGFPLTFSKAPDMTLNRIGGGSTNIRDYGGKTVLLNIWATWCQPCIVEMPSLQKLYDRFKANNFLVLGNSLDEDPKNALAFAREKGLSFDLFYADFEFTNGGGSVYSSTGIPTSYIIDKNGYIVYRVSGSRDWSKPELTKFVEMLTNIEKI